ncbi:lactose transport system permease protein LacF [Muribaculaceae bacterium]|nr:lactose transport system permease protein LacF [Muribaculaceae bacterium]
MKEVMKNERKRTFLLITIPILALFICFNTIPLIRGVIYSFTNFKGFGKYNWVGFQNYIDLFSDARVGKSYWFTFKLAIVSTVVTNVLSLILALGLNSKIKAKSFFRGAYFLPNILGALVVGYIFNYFFTYILPAVAQMMGIGALSSSILSNPSAAWIGIMVVCAWQAIAMNTIIYISGLQTVPEDVYEAGGLDGATGWKQFRYLTFPLIIPFFSINMVLCVKNFLMVFDQIMALTKGGPAQSTESISYLIYNNGMSGGQFGFQSTTFSVSAFSPLHAEFSPMRPPSEASPFTGLSAYIAGSPSKLYFPSIISWDTYLRSSA